jgi:hypothetical protein
LAALSGRALAQTPQQKQPNADLGFADTPMEPNLPYHVHDPDKPHPPVVTPQLSDQLGHNNEALPKIRHSTGLDSPDPL